MTNESLARSYLVKAEKRLKALATLRDEDAHSDVVREAQELVELALKGMLRAVGVEPPKFHDVGGLLVEHGAKFVPAATTRRPGCWRSPRKRSARSASEGQLKPLIEEDPSALGVLREQDAGAAKA